MEITFMTVNTAMPRLNRERVGEWLERVTRNHGKVAGRLTYIFCDDEYILLTNRQFLNHDYYTDIITFDYSTSRCVAGDMVISLDTVASNAAQLGESVDRELLRVVVHGLLHLCGINDKGPGEREVMERHENEALSLISVSEIYNEPKEMEDTDAF